MVIKRTSFVLLIKKTSNQKVISNEYRILIGLFWSMCMRVALERFVVKIRSKGAAHLLLFFNDEQFEINFFFTIEKYIEITTEST